jgi:hypothetical protein
MCETVEEGWRPCPESLCERADHDHGTTTWDDPLMHPDDDKTLL